MRRRTAGRMSANAEAGAFVPAPAPVFPGAGAPTAPPVPYRRPAGKLQVPGMPGRDRRGRFPPENRKTRNFRRLENRQAYIGRDPGNHGKRQEAGNCGKRRLRHRKRHRNRRQRPQELPAPGRTEASCSLRRDRRDAADSPRSAQIAPSPTFPQPDGSHPYAPPAFPATARHGYGNP